MLRNSYCILDCAVCGCNFSEQNCHKKDEHVLCIAAHLRMCFPFSATAVFSSIVLFPNSLIKVYAHTHCLLLRIDHTIFV